MSGSEKLLYLTDQVLLFLDVLLGFIDLILPYIINSNPAKSSQIIRVIVLVILALVASFIFYHLLSFSNDILSISVIVGILIPAVIIILFYILSIIYKLNKEDPITIDPITKQPRSSHDRLSPQQRMEKVLEKKEL